MEKKSKLTDTKLLETIIESIREKKGHNIVSIDLTALDNASTDHFVICQAPSPTQVEAIADNIEDRTREMLAVKPNHIEGKQNAMWVLVDYPGVMVHIFQDEYRGFYRLEELWADGVATTYADEA